MGLGNTNQGFSGGGGAGGTSCIDSIGLTMPSAFNVCNSPLTCSGTINVCGAGLVSQYIRGDGTLADFPSTGGGSSVNYYLNGSVNQGTFGGDVYYQMSKTALTGASANFTRTNAQGNGYIASFITDAGDPYLLNIPSGNWNLEFYFSSSSTGGNPSFYGELYKVSASNVFTLISSNAISPEIITGGTSVDQYFTSIAVPQTTLLQTDRLAIRIYVTTSGRNITLHTQDNTLSEVLTTFTTGITALNGLTEQVQFFSVGTCGTDFNIDSCCGTHTFNLPTASCSASGALSAADYCSFSQKVMIADTGCCSTVRCGVCNCASGCYSFAGGGYNNTSLGCHSFAGGGISNCACGNSSFVGGGYENLAKNNISFIGGGFCNCTCGDISFVGGGGCNSALSTYSFVGGGLCNTVSGCYSFAGGGYNNTSLGCHSFIGGGISNCACGNSSFVGGGYENLAKNNISFIGGGFCNCTCGDISFVGGGGCNSALSTYSFIGGGLCNCASAAYSFSGGGLRNSAVGGYSFAGGGGGNCAAGAYSFVGGGGCNCALGASTFIGGGYCNCALELSSLVVGGYCNRAVGNYSFISGGYYNYVCGVYSFAGGLFNTVSGAYSGAVGCCLNACVAATFYVNNLCTCGSLYSSALTSGCAVCTSTNGQLVGYTPTVPTAAIMVLGTGCCSTVRCGVGNCASCTFSFAGGGCCNTASGVSSFVGSGFNNQSTNLGSIVVGGDNNISSNQVSFIGNGQCNIACGDVSLISNGLLNVATTSYSTVINGRENVSCAAYSIVSNGKLNTASSNYSITLNGCNNKSCQFASTVINGLNNTASGSYSIVSGYNNCALNNYSTVLNGFNNISNGCHATVINGLCNTVSGAFSSASGCCLNACNACTFYSNNFCACGSVYSSALSCNCAVCISANGQLVGYTPSGGITGSGTCNFVPKFTGSTSIGNSLVYDNGTTVGINTTTPSASYKLDVNGTANFYTSTVGATVLTVQGSTGQLFTVSDIITGNLLQVNDVSGLPLMAVNANGAMYMYSASLTGITASPTTAYTIDKTTGTAAYFDYRITNTVNSGWRAGTVMVVWDGTNVEFTDTSTNDITATTAGLSWSATISGSNLNLVATITSGTWNIKIGARVI